MLSMLARWNIAMFAIFQFSFILLCVSANDVDDNVNAKPYFIAPDIPKDAYLALYFASSSDLTNKMVLSQARKDGGDDALSKYDGKWSVEVPEESAIDGDYALVLKSQAKHHAVSIKLNKPITFDTKEIVVQYEVKFPKKVDCGGAYVKLLSALPDNQRLQESFNDKTQYTIMFGPDKCGLDEKFHLIFRYKNPISGEYEEKHTKKVTESLDKYFSDGRSHLYTLVLRSDNTFQRYIDLVEVQKGSLLTDLEPSINPPTEIDDPSDKKPNDWDDVEQIIDKTAVKPADWDETLPEFIKDESSIKPDGWLDNEPLMISDPSAKVPADWDEDMDGKWDAPQIKNPKCENAPGCGKWEPSSIRNPNYKGKWYPPLIRNPNYKGVWTPRKIKNPNFFEDNNPLRNLAKVNALGLELWSMTNDIAFDNFLIVDSKEAADNFAAQTWSVKYKAEKMADPRTQSVWDVIMDTYHEKPWLIFVIGLLCILPIFLCCFFLCRSPRTTELHKKTDKFTPVDHVKSSPKSTDEEAEESVDDDDALSDSDAQIRVTGDESTEDKVDTASKQTLRKRRSRKE